MRFEEGYLRVLSVFPEEFRCYGFEHGDGWYAIVNSLCGLIQHHVDNPTREKDPATGLYTIITPRKQVISRQVKEKFGGLRFYVDCADEYVHGAIAMAERLSYSTCEECGATQGVSTNDDGWIRSLCDACRRIVRTTRVSSEEAERLNEIRKRVAMELPSILARHRKKLAAQAATEPVTPTEPRRQSDR